MKKVFVGIDISKKWLDLAVLEDFKPVYQVRIDNTVCDIKKCCNKLSKHFPNAELWFCFEHTGSYGLVLCAVLEELKFTYSMVPALEIKRSIGISRGKTDQIDAARIAEYAQLHRHKLSTTNLPSKSLLKLRELISHRDLLVKMKTQCTNSLKTRKISNQVINNDPVIQDLEKRIKDLKTGISSLDDQIREEVESDASLSQNFELITSVKGVGMIVAAYMLVTTNNFSTFDNPRKFNCYTGLAPFELSSGLSIGKARTSPLANKTMKRLLFVGASSASQYDPQLKKYYERKRAEGKPAMSVLNAVACKIVYRVFATVKRQTPYVTLQN